MAITAEEIHTLVEQLSPAYQQKVLKLAQELAQMQEFVNSLPEAKLPPGTPGKALRHIELPLEVAKEMERAIEEGCERIKPVDPALEQW
jgi:hypothetical protein